MNPFLIISAIVCTIMFLADSIAILYVGPYSKQAGFFKDHSIRTLLLLCVTLLLDLVFFS